MVEKRKRGPERIKLALKYTPPPAPLARLFEIVLLTTVKLLAVKMAPPLLLEKLLAIVQLLIVKVLNRSFVKIPPPAADAMLPLTVLSVSVKLARDNEIPVLLLLAIVLAVMFTLS